MRAYVGVDLGATNVKTAVGDADGAVVGRDRRPTPSDAGGEAIAAAVVESIRCSLAEAGVDGPIERVGIGSIGPLDRDAGVVVDPVNLPAAHCIPISDHVEAAIGAPVVLHNDATVGAIGECYFGDETPRNLVYLTLSTGVGAGVICDGRVLDGANGNAGEVGHLTLDPDAEVICGCGAVGHWEAFCGGANLPAYAESLRETTGVDGDERFDLPAAIFAATGSDPLADLVVERIGRWNAVGVASVVQAFDPEQVVLGGAVALNNPAAILDPIEARLPEMLLGDAPNLRLTDRGDTAVVDGALASAYTNGSDPASHD
ncbi:ROK family protein [Halobacteriales archaeon Cl-PHB]